MEVADHGWVTGTMAREESNARMHMLKDEEVQKRPGALLEDQRLSMHAIVA